MNESKTAPWGLFLARVSVGAMMLSHGLPKLLNFNDYFHTFPNPIGLGSETSYLLTVFAEFVCSVSLIAGFYPRLSALFGFITMIIAGVVVHGEDPFSKKEMSLLYAVIYLVIMTSGGGKFTLKKDV